MVYNSTLDKLHYTYLSFSFITLLVASLTYKKLETEKHEHALSRLIHNKKKKEIYKLRQSLNDSSRILKTILAQDGQAYLIFLEDGKVSLTYSRSCIKLLDCEPGNMHIGDVLRIPEEKREDFNNWIDILFQQLIDIEEAIVLGPKQYNDNKGRSIELSYEPIKNDVGDLLSILVVATDVTDYQKVAQQAAEKAEESEVIARLIKQRESFTFFIQDFNNEIKNFSGQILKEELDVEIINEYLRFLHNIKGGLFQIGLSSFAHQIHAREDLWDDLIDKPDKHRELLKNDISFLREEWFKFISKYSKILGYSLDDTERIVEFRLSEVMGLFSELSNLAGTENLQLKFKDKMTKSLENYFEQYQDLIKEVGEDLNKKLYPLKIVGGELKIIPEVYKDLFISLGHLFRNSIDHGIESFERREELNKDPIGTIEVRFSKIENDEKNSELKIDVIDDGKGIDPNELRNILTQEGDTNDIHIGDNELIQKIFEIGVSTKLDKKNIFSGRGVGVNVVKETVEKMGGSIYVSSSLNKGCHFKIQVPWVELDKQCFKFIESIY